MKYTLNLNGILDKNHDEKEEEYKYLVDEYI